MKLHVNYAPHIQNRREIYLGSSEDLLNTVGNLRANTITGDEGNGVVALQIHDIATSVAVFHLLAIIYVRLHPFCQRRQRWE